MPADPALALQALSDEHRRSILEQLASGPASVQQLADGLPISRPAVSRHLRVLREAQLVEEEWEGTRHVFSLRAEGAEAVRDYLAAVWSEAAARFRIVAENR